jgi:hypothetical protein
LAGVRWAQAVVEYFVREAGTESFQAEAEKPENFEMAVEIESFAVVVEIEVVGNSVVAVVGVMVLENPVGAENLAEEVRGFVALGTGNSEVADLEWDFESVVESLGRAAQAVENSESEVVADSGLGETGSDSGNLDLLLGIHPCPPQT